MKRSVFLRKLIFIFCCLFALSLPFDFSLKNINLDVPGLNSFLMLQIAALFLLWEGFVLTERRLDIKTAGIFLPLSVFFALHIFSSVFPSQRMIWSLKYSLRFFGLSLVMFVLINFVTNKKQLRWIINCLFISAGIAAGFVIIQYFFPYLLSGAQLFFDDAQIDLSRVRGLFGWPTDMAAYLGVFIPLILSQLIYKKQGRYKFAENLFYAFLLVLISAALVFSRTRGWIAGAFCGLITLWILDAITKKEKAQLYFCLAALSLAALLFLVSGVHRLFLSDLEPSEAGRLAFIKEAFRLIKEYPFRGIGADMFYWNADLTGNFRTHNIFLETFVNLGVFGLSALLWLLYVIFKKIGKGLFGQGPCENRYLRMGIIAALAAFLGHNQVDYFWQSHEIAGLFWFLAGIGVSERADED